MTRVVITRDLSRSSWRATTDRASGASAPEARPEIPSSTATAGGSSSMSLASMARWVSGPSADARAAQTRNRPLSICGRKSKPIDRILRRNWSGDSSNKTSKACSPRWQAECTRCALEGRLARARAPAHHERRSSEQPAAQHMVEAGYARGDPLVRGVVVEGVDVTGSTTKPLAEIRNGYSLVPCADPRYLITRSRRVEISSLTR